MKCLILEPFFGGSHQNFTENLIKYSGAEFTLYTLPARFWKWRMRGAALYFYKKVPNPEDYDLLFISDLMSLSDLKALWQERCPKSIVYFHESQLSYPLPPGEKMDYQFGFTDVTTGLVADQLLFNSQFHFNAFFERLPKFIKMMPEFQPTWAVETIKNKSSVIYPGCDFPKSKEARKPSEDEIPLIVWNHRWEFDKCPEVFFKALETVREREPDLPFKIVLLGENFQVKPKPFLQAQEKWKDEILQYGFLESREEYIHWLKRGSLIISTSIQENFGISVVEGMAYGCYPILPNRLSYPELLMEKHRSQILYKDFEGLVNKIIWALKHPKERQDIAKDMMEHVGQFAWEEMVLKYDRVLRSRVE